jgi:hypothetical protein
MLQQNRQINRPDRSFGDLVGFVVKDRLPVDPSGDDVIQTTLDV